MKNLSNFATSRLTSLQVVQETMELHNRPSTSSSPAVFPPAFRLRSHSRSSLISTTSIHSLGPRSLSPVPSSSQWSSEDLEIFSRRSSTPLSDNSQVTSRDEEWSLESAAYRIFLEMMQEKRKDFRVRGLKPVPEGYFSGHLLKHKKKDKNEKDFVLESFGLDNTEEAAAVDVKKKWNMQNTYKELKKIVSNFFRNCCKAFLKNKCNEGDCPLTCECQKIKSFLNKRYDFEAEEELKKNKRKKKEEKKE